MNRTFPFSLHRLLPLLCNFSIQISLPPQPPSKLPFLASIPHECDHHAYEPLSSRCITTFGSKCWGKAKICTGEHRISPSGYLLLLLHDGCQQSHHCRGMWCSFLEWFVPGVTAVHLCLMHLSCDIFVLSCQNTYFMLSVPENCRAPFIISYACCFENWFFLLVFGAPNFHSLDSLHQNWVPIMTGIISIHFQWSFLEDTCRYGFVLVKLF